VLALQGHTRAVGLQEMSRRMLDAA
jgi:hypothetical protein